jgi:hypothetical protein
MSSGIDYITQDKADIQRVVEDEKKEQEAINGKNERAIETANQNRREAIKAANELADHAVSKSHCIMS